MLAVQGLTKRYGALLAIQDISFEARPGEVLGLLGPNGSGKSTTVKILTGLLPPTDGTLADRRRGIDTAAHRNRGSRRGGRTPVRARAIADDAARRRSRRGRALDAGHRNDRHAAERDAALT
jgi:ABC-type branched-subunit amino acid transport system ATPase component